MELTTRSDAPDGMTGAVGTATAPDSDQFSRALLSAMLSFRAGDFAARMPADLLGVEGKIADAFNDVVALSERRSQETARVSRAVGKEGKLKRRAALPEARGFWAESVECVNSLIDDLVHPTSEVARVIGAVAQGDLSKSMALELEGRPLEG